MEFKSVYITFWITVKYVNADLDSCNCSKLLYVIFESEQQYLFNFKHAVAVFV